MLNTQQTHDIQADKLGDVLNLYPRKRLNNTTKILLQQVVIERLEVRLNDWITD